MGLPDAPPPVDFTDEIVIWFGAVFGSSCPDLRLDDVVVDADRAIVHADIVLADPPAACTSDANPYAFVVALARTRLPRGSFAIQLDADGPPAGAPEERTLVGVDLSAPGATAGPGDLTSGTAPPAPGAIPAGSTIEPGVEHAYRLDTHCGVEWLGELNGVRWRADPDDSSLDTVWQAWQQLAGEGEVLDLVLVLDVTAAPRITARAGGDELIYMPTNEPVPPCD